ncbi:LPS assembly lipoprotein LptE [Noviherbaspirillum massiliense]|uniref:LPS-assembly lipoprotein LptE n=1 Tax=Noviherbaspirillum massiliense TaxID=1465823 RepID=UPI000310290E|nr:LPS assembly lipoprotein LptE [Noviherbaspirillum massiliense]
MPNKRQFLFALAAAAAVTLTSCGFQLRGSNGQTGLPFKTIYVNAPETSTLGAQLKRYIRVSGNTEVVSDPKSAEAVLDLLSEGRDKAVLSKNTQGRIREYTIFYKVRFRVRDGGNKDLLAPTDITLKRDLSFNESQVMAKEAEEELLYRDMQSDMVQQILRRMVALNPA